MENARGSEVRWYTRRSADAPEKGPFDTSAVCTSVREGLLSEKTLVRREDRDQWTPLIDEPSLATELRRRENPMETPESRAISELVDRAAAKRFSFGVALLHAVAAFVLMVIAVWILGTTGSHAHPFALADLAGRVFAFGLPVIFVVSYVYQTRKTPEGR